MRFPQPTSPGARPSSPPRPAPCTFSIPAARRAPGSIAALSASASQVLEEVESGARGCERAPLPGGSPPFPPRDFWAHPARRRAWIWMRFAAGVGEHGDAHRPRVRRRTGELDSALAQPAMLGIHVVDLEGVHRDPVAQQRVLVGARRRMGVRLEHEIRPLGSIRGHHRQPPVLPHRDVHPGDEAEDVSVEGERPILVLDVDADERDPHGGSPSAGGVLPRPSCAVLLRNCVPDGCSLIPSARSSRAETRDPADRSLALGTFAASSPSAVRTPR